jgi:hypothetical protein
LKDWRISANCATRSGDGAVPPKVRKTLNAEAPDLFVELDAQRVDAIEVAGLWDRG